MIKNVDFNKLNKCTVLYTAALYNRHKRTPSPSNKALIACYDPELKRNEGRTRDRDKQVGCHADVSGGCENAALPLISPSPRQHQAC